MTPLDSNRVSLPIEIIFSIPRFVDYDSPADTRATLARLARASKLFNDQNRTTERLYKRPFFKTKREFLLLARTLLGSRRLARLVSHLEVHHKDEEEWIDVSLVPPEVGFYFNTKIREVPPYKLRTDYFEQEEHALELKLYWQMVDRACPGFVELQTLGRICVQQQQKELRVTTANHQQQEPQIETITAKDLIPNGSVYDEPLPVAAQIPARIVNLVYRLEVVQWSDCEWSEALLQWAKGFGDRELAHSWGSGLGRIADYILRTATRTEELHIHGLQGCNFLFPNLALGPLRVLTFSSCSLSGHVLCRELENLDLSCLEVFEYTSIGVDPPPQRDAGEGRLWIRPSPPILRTEHLVRMLRLERCPRKILKRVYVDLRALERSERLMSSSGAPP